MSDISQIRQEVLADTHITNFQRRVYLELLRVPVIVSLPATAPSEVFMVNVQEKW